MSVKKKDRLVLMMTDASVPLEARLGLLQQLFDSEEEVAKNAVSCVLEAAASASADETQKAKAEELSLLLDQLRQGPLRCAPRGGSPW